MNKRRRFKAKARRRRTAIIEASFQAWLQTRSEKTVPEAKS